MILLIKLCKEPFHFFEFVKPIQDILNTINVEFVSKNYKELSKKLLSQADKIIICGTSLKDNSFLQDVQDFAWIKHYHKPLLGICGGMHLLGLVYHGKIQQKQEIGLTQIEWTKEFFGMVGKKEVYELHKYVVTSSEFEIQATSLQCPQAIKHKHKSLYGVLFHPEVRNKELIKHFVKTTN